MVGGIEPPRHRRRSSEGRQGHLLFAGRSLIKIPGRIGSSQGRARGGCGVIAVAGNGLRYCGGICRGARSCCCRRSSVTRRLTQNLCHITPLTPMAKSTARSCVRACESVDEAAATSGCCSVALQMFPSTTVTCQRHWVSALGRTDHGPGGGGGGHDGASISIALRVQLLSSPACARSCASRGRR